MKPFPFGPALAGISALLILPVVAVAATDPAIKCQATKLKLTGKYTACRLLADAAALQKGIDADYTRCEAKLQTKWAAVEADLGAECPTLGDLMDVEEEVHSCLPTTHYEVHFSVTSAATLAEFSFRANYSTATGEIDGNGSSASCVMGLAPGTALEAYNNNLTTLELVAGVVDFDGFPTPELITTCQFTSNGIAAPDPADFVVTVEAADDVMGNPVVPTPTMSVTVLPAAP